ncbi:hypothetical protein ILUMI_00869 [Ignelater luminosus]|uniref:Fanconi anemia group D2 protein n=1 Tax=Ignelater luminosus TaxID=2038154 RepID=A0A8K0DFF9_IGNLU|nr:hypothetical protein ILUMI_00869 [Ignelater luminosus]
MSDKKGVTPVLNVLTSLLEDFEILQQHSVQLMGLLEKLDAIELKDAKLIFNLLCSLTCGERADDSMSGLHDEIHMIVRKQLSSAKKIVKHRGIIAAVAMAKALVTMVEQQSQDVMDDNSMTIADLPSGNPQDAATLLTLANTCTLGSPDSVGLYYDQLASMLMTTTNLDHQFMAWLYKLITGEFQNIFITESVPAPVNDIEMSMQYSLNTAEEVDAPIAVNIAELSLRSQYYENNSILTLAPLFRLLRLIHFRQHDKDLSTIDALLGCSVIMPNLNDIYSYDTEQLKQVTDCIFHCINWFREVISAFVTQKNRKLRHKVLERLTDVVSLENLLEKCLESIPEHKLPSSYFDVLSQTSKQLSPSKGANKVTRPRKKQKISDTIINPDDTVASTSAAVTQTTKTTTTTASKKKSKELIKTSENIFREMDTDIILLLRYPLKIDDLSSTVSQSSMVSQTTVLDINQFQFLMKDFVNKLETLSKNKDLGFSHMNVVNLNDLIADSIRLLPYIKKHLNVILSNIDSLLGQTDGCLDSEQIFTPEANNLKTAFALIIKSFNLIFGWSGFQHTKNLNLLKDCLKALRDETQSQMISVKGLSMEFATKTVNYVNYCLYLPSAVNLVQTIQSLYLITSNPELKKKITLISEKLLNKKWYNTNGDLEMGKNSSLHTDTLVKAYLSGASVKTVGGLVGTLQGQVSELKAKDDCLNMLSGINKMNFYIFYRCLCNTLVEAVKIEITSLTNNQHLVLWRATALTMQGLMTVVKAQETRTNLTSFLKSSVGILKIFLSSGIPILEIMLRSKTDEVIEIFKIIQTSTRFLHHLCCYSKYTKDTSLVAYVPQFRLLLESLLYRVKAALVANGCSAAFWMGTLRNRDLHGEDILSQSSMQTDESEQTGSDNEELPPDESEGEETEAPAAEEGGAASDGDSSASEIF